jgi:hypothetical protein
MERMSNRNNGNGLENGSEVSGWEAWDAVPRDGPAVFVVDVGALDHGVVRGRWLDARAEQEVLHGELTELLGSEPEEGAWAIVDQVGLGELMAPETMTVPELATVAEDLAAERRG